MSNLKNMGSSYPGNRLDLNSGKRFEAPRRITPDLSPNRIIRFLDRSSEASPVTSWEEEVLSFSSTQNWPLHLVYENAGEHKATGTIELICYIFDGIVTGVTYSRIEKANLWAETALDYFPLIEEVGKVSAPFFEDVQNFCDREGILEHLATALELVGKNFSLVQAPTLKLMVDPETKAEWVIVEFTARGNVAEVLENHRNYTKNWIASVPWPDRRKIRLEFDMSV